MSSSDSEDDIPLSKLRKIEYADDDDSEDDVPISKLKKISDDDSDDDVCLSALVQKKKTVNAATKPVKRRSSGAKVKSKGSESKKIAPTSVGFKQQECSEALYTTLKGSIVQSLLCRWWYAIKWPVPEESYNVEEGTQELDGFKGAFIVVKGDEMGTIHDQRKNVGKPTFINLFAKPAEQLKSLLDMAYAKQIEILQEKEGKDHHLLPELVAQRKLAARINCEKADKEAKRYLKEWKKFSADLQKLQS